jgi:hypothetical protein
VRLEAAGLEKDSTGFQTAYLGRSGPETNEQNLEQPHAILTPGIFDI